MKINQIVVGLEWVLLSVMRIIEKLFERKSRGPV
jgi:hypothetical protein